MLSAQEQLSRLRVETRKLRIYVGVLSRARVSQQNRADKLREEVKEKNRKISQLEKEKTKLQTEIEELKRQRDIYKGMVFKPNQVGKKILEEVFGQEEKKKSRGGILGHQGHGRKLPSVVHHSYRLHLHHCPECFLPLARGGAVSSHTVEDIPTPKETRIIVSCYDSERQWCPRCQKEVTAVPAGVIPRCRLGINLLSLVLLWKYRTRMPLLQIKANLQLLYGLKISLSALEEILYRAREYLGENHQKILRTIRSSPVKHADETSWRTKGENGWLWEFLTGDAVYYTIEETRGKGVPEIVLSGAKETDVLVHDDYAAYQNLPGCHQSCWAHLLREARNEAGLEFASQEAKALYQELKVIFSRLEEIIREPFIPDDRQKLYQEYLDLLTQIGNRNYQNEDVKRVQTRIKNQAGNLLTALLFPGVPLTNNLAERNIRPVVIARKISGGSKTVKGAQTFAVNASVIQTLVLRKEPLFSSLKEMLLTGAAGKN